jgi:hypothetical protein
MAEPSATITGPGGPPNPPVALTQEQINQFNERLAAAEQMRGSSRHDLLPKPPRFNGNREEYDFWRIVMRNKIAMDRIHTSTVQQQQYVIAYFFDEAGRYIQNYAAAIENGEFSMDAFWLLLDGRFQDPHRAQRAENQLSQLKQGTKPFVEFYVEFQRLWTETNRSTDANEKIRSLQHKLSAEMRNISAIAIAILPATFEEYVNRLHSLDTSIQAAKIDGSWKSPISGNQALQNQGQPSRSRGQQAATIAPSAPQGLAQLPAPRNIAKDPDIMDLDPRVNRLSTQKPRLPEKHRNPSQHELRARKDAGACLNCGNDGHRARRCLWAPHSVRLNQLRTTTTSTLEPRLPRSRVEESSESSGNESL